MRGLWQVLAIAIILFTGSCFVSAEPQQEENWEVIVAYLKLLTKEMNARADAGKFHEARVLAEELVALAERLRGPNHPWVTAGLIHVGLYALREGDYVAAEKADRRILHIYDLHPREDQTRIAVIRQGLGLALKGQLKYRQAQAETEKALQIYEQSYGPNHAEVAGTLINLGEVLHEQGDYAGARARYDRALAIREQNSGPHHPDVAVALHRLGRVLYDQGDYVGAHEVLERAIEIDNRTEGADSTKTAESVVLLAQILRQRQDLVKARLLLERSLKILERARGPDHLDVAVVLNSLGTVLYLQQDAQAFSVLARSVKIYEKELQTKHGLEEQRRILADGASALGNLATLLYVMREHDTARRLLERSLRMYEQTLGPTHPRVAGVLSNLARLHYDAGDYKKAKSLYKRSIRILEQTRGRAHSSIAHGLRGLARVKWTKGDVKAAADLVRRASRIENHAFDRLLVGMSQRQRLVAIETGRSGLDFFLSLPTSVVEANAVYQATLRWKNAIFRTARAERWMVEALSGELQSLYDQYDEARRRLATLALRGPGTDVRTYRAMLAQQTGEVERLERELSRKSAAFRKQREERQVGPAEVCHALSRDSALIEYVWYSRYQPPPAPGLQGTWTPSYAAFILLGGKCIEAPFRINLGPAHVINAAVRDLRVALKVGLAGMTPVPSVQERAHKLDALIFPPPLRHALTGKSQVLIAPDGMLALVPFILLPGDQGREFLLETRTISHVPSGRDLLRFNRTPRPATPPWLLAVGSPDFSNAPVATAALRGTRALCAIDETVTFDPLPGTSREIADIAQLATAVTVSPPTILTGPEATKARFAAVLRGKTVLHLATHAYFAGEQCQPVGQARTDRSLFGAEPIRLLGEDPLLLSGLALTGANRDPAQGILTALEVTTLDLRHVELVVLSACDTGLGRLNPGQELLGLRWAFAYAGARNLVTSLWQVADEPTTALMARFYEELWQKKLGPAAALRQAQLARLQANRATGTPRPWEWAAFTLSGPAR